MNINTTTLFTYSGIIEAPFDQVSGLLFEAPPLGRVSVKNLPYSLSSLAGNSIDSLVIEGGPIKYTISQGTEPYIYHLSYMDIDRSQHILAYYGGWWYRIEYMISSHMKGTHIISNIVNVAPRLSRLLLPFSKEFRFMFSNASKVSTRQAFDQFLKDTAKHFDVKAYIL